MTNSGRPTHQHRSELPAKILIDQGIQPFELNAFAALSISLQQYHFLINVFYMPLLWRGDPIYSKLFVC
jgi:hypothetical protein